jgi:glycosyltransferase involved in cell wall biosynthesis
MVSQKKQDDAAVQDNEAVVWINARFLTRPVTGVERAAHEIISALAEHRLDEHGCWSYGRTRYRFKLIAPKSANVCSPWKNIPLERRGLFSGHTWEQFALPVVTRGDTLLSLCNTGPVLKRLHTVFLHDAQPFAIPQNFSFKFRLWYKLLFSLLTVTARAVLVNSLFTFSELQKYLRLNPSKTFLCYLGCDHVYRHTGSKEDLQKFRLPAEDFILAVSSSNRNKNFAAVVEALALLGDAAPPCVIVGQRDQKHFEVTSFNSAKVHHLGYVSDLELTALYRQAMCLVFPSFYEGFGLPPLEAMAVGCPVIVSNCSALKEVAGKGAELCDPEIPQSLAQAIMEIKHSPERRISLAGQGKRLARRYSWRRTGDCVLQSILSGLPAETCPNTGITQPPTPMALRGKL